MNIFTENPEFDNLPREDAIATAILVYLPIGRADLSNYGPEDKLNTFFTYDGQEIGTPEIMAMLREKYGD